MKNPKIKEDFEHSKLKELGYKYDIMEAGYISKDFATIVFINRSPYQREVTQFIPNAEVAHEENVEQLRQMDVLEQ